MSGRFCDSLAIDNTVFRIFVLFSTRAHIGEQHVNDIPLLRCPRPHSQKTAVQMPLVLTQRSHSIYIVSNVWIYQCLCMQILIMEYMDRAEIPQICSGCATSEWRYRRTFTSTEQFLYFELDTCVHILIYTQTYKYPLFSWIIYAKLCTLFSTFFLHWVVWRL